MHWLLVDYGCICVFGCNSRATVQKHHPLHRREAEGDSTTGVCCVRLAVAAVAAGLHAYGLPGHTPLQQVHVTGCFVWLQAIHKHQSYYLHSP